MHLYWIVRYIFIATAIQLKSLLLTTWELVLLRFCLSVSWINLRCFNPLQCWDRAKRTINYASNIPIERVLSLPVHTHSASVLPVLEFPRASYCLSIVFKCRFRKPHSQKESFLFLEQLWRIHGINLLIVNRAGIDELTMWDDNTINIRIERTCCHYTMWAGGWF